MTATARFRCPPKLLLCLALNRHRQRNFIDAHIDRLAVQPGRSGTRRFTFTFTMAWNAEQRAFNQERLFRHYRELVTPEQAEKWWDIRPAIQANLVAISA